LPIKTIEQGIGHLNVTVIKFDEMKYTDHDVRHRHWIRTQKYMLLLVINPNNIIFYSIAPKLVFY